MSIAATARPGVEQTYATHADLGHLGHDRDLADRIMRKRQEEMQRRTKLLDPRKRQFGTDHAELDAQLAAKRGSQEAEVAAEAAFAEGQLMQDHVLQTLEGIKQNAARERHKAVNDFSVTNLRKEDRREYDLSDPNALKKQVPVNPDDAQLGPSCFQRFSGQEPPNLKAHKKALQQQQREFLLEQMREKEQRRQAELEEDRKYDQHTLMATQVRSYCEHVELEERRQDKRDEAEINRHLADGHAQRRQARAQREAEEKARHVHNVVNDDRMREAHDWKVGQTGKLVEYKRLSLDEEQEVYNEMARQMLEKQGRKQAEAAEDAEHARAQQTQVQVLQALEHERARQQKERLQRVVDHNKGLAASKHGLDDDERRKYRSFHHEP